MRERTALLLITIPFIVYLFAFCYVPLFGWLYAFLDFRPAFGANPFIHKFVGLANFAQIFREKAEILRALRNTLAMSVMGLATAPLPVVFAILMMEMRGNVLKRVTQTITTFPNFISYIILYGIVFSFFSNNGVFAAFTQFLGFPKQTVGAFADVGIAWTFQTLLGVWKGLGYGAIIYCAAIAGIDQSLYEAARIDGANKFRCILHITVPGVAQTFLVMFLLSVSNILSNNFDQLFVFNNNMVTERLMNLDLYVYRIGVTQNQTSFSIAVGMVKTFIGLILLFSMNKFSKRVRGESLI